MHCKERLFLFSNRPQSYHRISSWAHGEKLYYVQWLIIKHCRILQWHSAGEQNLRHHDAHLTFHPLYFTLTIATALQKNTVVHRHGNNVTPVVRLVICSDSLSRLSGTLSLFNVTWLTYGFSSRFRMSLIKYIIYMNIEWSRCLSHSPYILYW